MALERVQKILAQVGIASRRKAEELITLGLVTVNGRVIQLGEKAELGKDAIKVEGKLIGAPEKPVYVAFYKPKAVISMMEDPEKRPALSDYLNKVRGRIFPIGRLDFLSEGLLLLTNDGAFAEKIQKHDDIPRVYHVKVKGHPDAEMLSRVERGVRMNNKLIKPHSLRVVQELTSKAYVEVVMMGAGAVDVKALFELKGFLVEKIVRTAIGHLSIQGMAPGEYTLLKDTQVQALIDQPELGLQRVERQEQEDQERKEKKARGAARAEGFRRAAGIFPRTRREDTESSARSFDAERPARRGFGAKSFDGERPAKRGFGAKSFDGERPAKRGFGAKSFDGERPAKRGFGAKSFDGERPAKRGFGAKSFDGERPAKRGFGAKSFDGERPAKRGFGAKSFDGERPAKRGFGAKSFDGERPAKRGFGAKSFDGERPAKRGFGAKSFDGERPAKRGFGAKSGSGFGKRPPAGGARTKRPPRNNY